MTNRTWGHGLPLWIASIGLILTNPGEAGAWGTIGHAVIADIAEAHLTLKAKAKVQDWLSMEGHHHLDEIASWADYEREKEPRTGPWHFVDIPLEAETFDPVRDCPESKCVVAQIDRLERIVGSGVAFNRVVQNEEYLADLKFLVHFIGDIHQPLHAANNRDKGGNGISISYPGAPEIHAGHSMNLHALWDSLIIESHLGVHGGRDAHKEALLESARGLAATIDTPAARAELSELAKIRDPKVWADESHRVARDVAYKGIARPGEPSPEHADIDADYDRAAWALIQRQLELAGLRLAEVLNRDLG